MTTARRARTNDHHGDRFPGALTAPPARAQKRLAPMHAAYVHKMNSAVADGNDDLVHELAQGFDEEFLTGRAARGHVRRRTGSWAHLRPW